jgi:hypothetical protein
MISGAYSPGTGGHHVKYDAVAQSVEAGSHPRVGPRADGSQQKHGAGTRPSFV